MRQVTKQQISLALLLGFFSSTVLAVTNYHNYSTYQAALAACQAIQPECGSYSNLTKSYCSPTSARQYVATVGTTTDVFWGCVSGVTTCVSPEVLQEDGTCASPPIVQDCPKDQYRDASSNCVSAPDCNDGYSEGGYFFDVETASCQHSTDNDFCFGGDLFTVRCPPINDCITSGQICSNNQANLDDASSTQPARNAAAKDAAETSSDQAAAASADAAAAAAAKEAASAAAQANKAAAESAAAQQQSIDPTSQATADALATAAAAASEAAQAAQKAINSAAQALQAATEAARAAADDAAIESTTGGGHSENLSYDAGLAAGLAIGALQGAIQGRALDGSPGGSGSGDDMGTCPGCATESTLQNLMAGSGNAKAAPGSGSFDQASVDAEEAAAKAEFEALITTIRGEIESVISFDQAGPGALPVIQYGTIKGKAVSADYSRFSPQLSWLGYTILFAAAIISAMIVFG
jgi:hypothetical protein